VKRIRIPRENMRKSFDENAVMEFHSELLVGVLLHHLVGFFFEGV